MTARSRSTMAHVNDVDSRPRRSHSHDQRTGIRHRQSNDQVVSVWRREHRSLLWTVTNSPSLVVRMASTRAGGLRR